MMIRLGKGPRGEEGATLILALVFVLLTSVVMLAIVTLSGTNILNTTNLQNERSLEYSAEGAVQTAVQAVRYLDPSPMTSDPNSTADYCSSSHSFFPPNSATPSLTSLTPTVVDCQVETLIYQRTVTFEACLPSVSASNCTSNANNADLLKATVLIS